MKKFNNEKLKVTTYKDKKKGKLITIGENKQGESFVLNISNLKVKEKKSTVFVQSLKEAHSNGIFKNENGDKISQFMKYRAILQNIINRGRYFDSLDKYLTAFFSGDIEYVVNGDVWAKVYADIDEKTVYVKIFEHDTATKDDIEGLIQEHQKFIDTLCSSIYRHFSVRIDNILSVSYSSHSRVNEKLDDMKNLNSHGFNSVMDSFINAEVDSLKENLSNIFKNNDETENPFKDMPLTFKVMPDSFSGFVPGEFNGDVLNSIKLTHQSFNPESEKSLFESIKNYNGEFNTQLVNEDSDTSLDETVYPEDALTDSNIDSENNHGNQSEIENKEKGNGSIDNKTPQEIAVNVLKTRGNVSQFDTVLDFKKHSLGKGTPVVEENGIQKIFGFKVDEKFNSLDEFFKHQLKARQAEVNNESDNKVSEAICDNIDESTELLDSYIFDCLEDALGKGGFLPVEEDWSLEVRQINRLLSQVLIQNNLIEHFTNQPFKNLPNDIKLKVVCNSTDNPAIVSICEVLGDLIKGGNENEQN